MSKYDVVAGTDQTALNTLSESIYKGTYPKVFKGSISVGQSGIKSVDYDVQAAPVFTLAPSALVGDALRAQLGTALSGRARQAALDEVTQASLTVAVDKASITINYEDGTNTPFPNCSFNAGAQAQTTSDGYLVMRLLTGEIKTGNQQIDDILNKSFVPELIKWLNDKVLHPIKIPPLEFKGVSLSNPDVLVQDDVLLAFAAMKPAQVDPPPPGTWPTGKVFIGSDAPLLDAVANAFLADASYASRWEWKHDIDMCTVDVEADYKVWLSNAKFQLTPGSGNQITGTVDAHAEAECSAKCGIVDVPFSVSATATPTVTAAVSAVGPDIVVTFESMGKLDLDIQTSDLPDWLDWLQPVINLFVNEFAPILAGAITAFARGISFKVYTIPSFHFTIADIPFTVQLTQLALSTIGAPGDIPLVTVTGLADVTSPQMTVTVHV